MKAESLFLLIGGNQGDRMATLGQATDLIQQRIGSVVGSSAIYQTAPWGDFSEGTKPQDFLNQALEVCTCLPPDKCLDQALAIEKELGRVRKANAPKLYCSRPIDIDLILYGSLVLQSPRLTIPHPRMHLRRFVLMPLTEIAGSLIHPIFNKTISQLLSECSDNSSCSVCC